MKQRESIAKKEVGKYFDYIPYQVEFISLFEQFYEEQHQCRQCIYRQRQQLEQHFTMKFSSFVKGVRSKD